MNGWSLRRLWEIVAGTITALSFQKRNPDRVSVFLDGKFAFGLAALDAATLRRGQELSDGEIVQLRALDLRSKAYDRAVSFLAVRPRSIWEVEQNLRRYRPGSKRRSTMDGSKRGGRSKKADGLDGWEEPTTPDSEEAEEAAALPRLPDETIEWVIQKLTVQGYVDDRAFAQYWIDQRSEFKPMAPRALRYELRKKGVAVGIIDALVTEQVDADEAALDAARSRLYRWQHLTYDEFQHKMVGFLQRRGFSWSAVSAAVEIIWQEIETEQSDQ